MVGGSIATLCALSLTFSYHDVAFNGVNRATNHYYMMGFSMEFHHFASFRDSNSSISFEVILYACMCVYIYISVSTVFAILPSFHTHICIIGRSWKARTVRENIAKAIHIDNGFHLI